MRYQYRYSYFSLLCSATATRPFHDCTSNACLFTSLCEQSTLFTSKSFATEHWLLAFPKFIHSKSPTQDQTTHDMQLTLSLLTAASMAALANAHGYFTSPGARQPGTAFQKSCGMQAYYNMVGSINGNIQGLEQVVAGQSDYNPATCHLWKCKGKQTTNPHHLNRITNPTNSGMKYADNTAHVQHYTPGQTVNLDFQIVAPHSGYANVSIINLAGDSGSVIAPNLKKWSQYALTSAPIPESEEKFSIKMPTSLGSQCSQPGNCAIQMYWNAPSIDQTYESCIDFTLSGSSSKREAEGLEMEERAHARDFNRV